MRRSSCSCVVLLVGSSRSSDSSSFSVDTDHRSGTNARLWNDVAVDVETSATVKVWVDDTRHLAVGEGNGPVNALDAALRNALGDIYPALDRISLTDFKVRVLDTGKGTGAITRVLLDSPTALVSGPRSG